MCILSFSETAQVAAAADNRAAAVQRSVLDKLTHEQRWAQPRRLQSFRRRSVHFRYG